MYVYAWLFCVGLLVLVLVFAIAADCLAASGPPRPEGRVDGVDGGTFDEPDDDTGREARVVGGGLRHRP
eukprot:m.416223 g.416223  ORF g.416223 m.416223 type:complete len:69 (-) comp16830_c1_seq1:1709-1915(-)